MPGAAGIQCRRLPGRVAATLKGAWPGIRTFAGPLAAASGAMVLTSPVHGPAATVAFLVSPDASYVTGASLVVDGGWSVVKESA